jgi:hypothetical protein
MTTLSFTHWRQLNAEQAFWNAFAWFGRACDQAAGVLLNPAVVAVIALAVERDPFRLAWLVTGFGWGWLLGTAVTPFLRHLTERVMPWIIGGFVVRTAAVVLMTYTVTDSASSGNQRFNSLLICYVAYAIATGISRTAQARHLIHGSPHRLWDVHRAVANWGVSAVIAIAALASWSALDNIELSWSSSFGRILALASIALGVATLAAIREGADNPEAADNQPRSARSQNSPSRQVGSVMLLVTVGVAAMTFVEVVAFTLFFEEFRRQTVYLRGGIAFFAVGWAVGGGIWPLLRDRLLPALLAQIAIGVGAVGVIVALASADLTRADWFPDHVRDQQSVSLMIYATGLLVGLGMSGRRITLSDFHESVHLIPGWIGLLVSAIAAASPLLVGWFTREFSRDWVLVGGLVLTMLLLTLVGLIPVGADPRLQARARLSPAFLPRQ